MTTLHKLGVVDVSVAAGQGKAVLKELKNLTQLRKLGVSGINPANSKELWSGISGHGHLESLSVRLEDAGGEQSFSGCSDGTVFSPPEKLQSLKLHGLVGKLPAWIKQLQNLSKLNLHMTILAQEASPNLAQEALPNQEQADLPNQVQEALPNLAQEDIYILGDLPNQEQADLPNLAQEDIYILGDLPNLRILRLCLKPVQDGNLHFRRRPQDDCPQSSDCPQSFHTTFKCLRVLEIACNSRLQEVTFGDGVMQNLELLKVRGCSGSSLQFSGLRNLFRIKRIFLKDCDKAVEEKLRSEIGTCDISKPDLELE